MSSESKAWKRGFDAGVEAGMRWMENGGPDNDDTNPYDREDENDA